MKVLFLCALLVAAASASHHFPHNEPPTVMLVGNAIDNLVRSALEYIRKLMKEKEPLPVPNIIPEQDINDPDLKVFLKAHLSDVLVSKASDFKIDHIENKLTALWAKFGLTIPNIHVDGKYDVTGSATGVKVDGKGDFSAEVTDLTVNGFIQMEVVDHAMHMKDLKLNYTMDNVHFKITGLTVEGMTEEQLEEIFNQKLLAFFQDNMQLVTEKIARQVKIEANEIMKGKTLDELLDWLKHFIDN